MGLETSNYFFPKLNNIVLIFKIFVMIHFMSCIFDHDHHKLIIANNINYPCSNPNQCFDTTKEAPSSSSSSSSSSLQTLNLEGHLSLDNNHFAATDFGRRFHSYPLAVLHPKIVSDISTTVKHIYEMGPFSGLTVAARGHGHSLHGQAQAHQGVVINMESLDRHHEDEVRIFKVDNDDDDGKISGKISSDHENDDYNNNDNYYADVSGGELWINILHETLKHGLAPKSWTDYLHLTVGGTLSNAGISGQAFRHGPQINNVLQLQVITGKGEMYTCSEKQNADLFYGVLGGLGQFGIITRAQISLEKAPTMVKWIRALYTDFSKFTKDQEYLISSKRSKDDQFDYIEGFVIINRTGLVNSWSSSFNPKDPQQASQFKSDGRTLYCLELAKYNFNPDQTDSINKKVESLLSELSYIPATLFLSEVPYVDFLDRVHISEKKLREKGLWEIPHPWLNLLIPKSKVHSFSRQVFGNMLTDSSNEPILIYPVNKSKWCININRTSFVTPDEEIFYLVAFLSSAMPSSTRGSKDSLEYILDQNNWIMNFCVKSLPGCKQYLPQYSTREEWRAHYGNQWQVFVKRKSAYDPLAMLAPGQGIFKKGIPFS